MNNLNNKNVLVTGGTGFVGSHLVEALVKEKAHVVTTFQTMDPQSYFFSQKLNRKTVIIKSDIFDFDEMFRIVTNNEIDFIFHLAACSLVDEAFYNPRNAYKTNVMGTVNILESARQYPRIKGIVVASTDKSYGKIEYGRKYKESDALKGDHPYEASKAGADLAATSYFKTYHIPVTVTRFGNIYGEGDLNFSRIIPGILKAMIRDEELGIRSDGKYIRDYLYVKDVISGYLLLAESIDKIKGEAFNFGSEESLSVIELIKLIEKTLRKKIKHKILNTAKNEIPYQSLDYSKIQKKLGWKPKYKLIKVIHKMKKWYADSV